MKKLVIYFSRTGENYMSAGIREIPKGNTEIVAEKIAEITGADLFKVETIKEYPNDYYECCDVAKEEKNTNARPKLKRYLDDISLYDTIYIGYPIWWGTYPMAIASLIERLDLSGKTIKPFATHEGSGLANSVNDLIKACPNANVENGIAIRGSDASIAQDKLASWV